MTHPGLGFMIQQLSGNRGTVDAWKAAKGKVIKSIEVGDDRFVIQFKGGSILRGFDCAQSCCESRYLRTDDNLSAFVGAKLLDMEMRNAPNLAYGSDAVHEVQFWEIKTSNGPCTISSHNEHNGYYSGILIELVYTPKESK